MQKVAVITGASSGIGIVTAKLLAKAGYKTLLIARSEEVLKQLAKEIVEAGGEAKVLAADLSAVEPIRELITDIKAEETVIDALINIAGIWHGENEVYAGKRVDQFSEQVILDTYMVGVVAPTLLVRGLLPLMNAGSSVVNLSGTFENGGKGWVPYFASKRALEDFTIGLADDLKEKTIRVNCVSPSDVATKQYGKYFPEYMSEAIEPEKVAEQIVALCSEKSELTGKVIVVKKGKDPFEAFHS